MQHVATVVRGGDFFVETMRKAQAAKKMLLEASL